MRLRASTFPRVVIKQSGIPFARVRNTACLTSFLLVVKGLSQLQRSIEGVGFHLLLDSQLVDKLGYRVLSVGRKASMLPVTSRNSAQEDVSSMPSTFRGCPLLSTWKCSRVRLGNLASFDTRFNYS